SVVVSSLHDVRAAGGKPEGTDHIRAEEIGVPKRHLVIQVVYTIRIDRQWIFAVIGRGNVQFPDGKAPEERITGTLLPVDSADIQVLMLIGDVPVFHGAALVDCRRQRRSELQGRWIQLARIDFVSGERWRKIFTFTRSLARVGSKARKVAPKH